uniref:carbonic anhydrase 2-like n=1 Tax=Myxine glutinosa TaxID=7769 RepID=UPI00358F23DA
MVAMLVFVLFSLLCVRISSSKPGGTPWCYDSAKSCGPNNWSSGYKTCAGLRQSPVDLDTFLGTFAEFPPITLTGYDTISLSSWNLQNDGHSVVASLPTGMVLSGAGLNGPYHAIQFHFHWGSAAKPGSEHSLNKLQFPMELHIVHYSSRYGSVSNAKRHGDGLAVLGVFLQLGPSNRALDGIVNALANTRYKGQQTVIPAMPLASLLPDVHQRGRFARYQGSLTTPSCDEAVVWTVFLQPISISLSQMEAFRNVQATESSSFPQRSMMNNNRPVQPVFGRSILIASSAMTATPIFLPFCFLTLSVFPIVM